MNAKRKFLLSFVSFAFLAALATSAAAQAPPAMPPQPLTVNLIKDNVYWTQGGGDTGFAGGNTGFIIGKDGVIVFDAKMTTSAAKDMLAAIAKITPKPVTTVILSHSDGDHVNGLAAFPKGLTIIAQENCKKEMEESKGTPNGAPQDYLPTKTYDKELNTTINGVRIELFHWAPAHTSGDTVMYLPEEKIVFGGDLVDFTQFAFVHPPKGGSTAGWITSMKGVAALDANIFVTGHGGLTDKATVKARLAVVSARRTQIEQMVKAGKSLDEIKKTRPADEPATGPFNSPGFTEVVYTELTKKG